MSDAPKLYQPSNGTEGDMFIEEFCMNCERDKHFWDDTGEGCEIAARTYRYDIDDPEYPREWIRVKVIAADGLPVSCGKCTAFVPLGGQTFVDTLFAPEVKP